MYLYAIDLGGTAVKHAVVNWPDPHCPEHSYQLLEKSSFPTPYKDADHLITLLNSKIQQALREYPIAGVAVSTPGGVSNHRRGIIHRGGKLRYLDQVPFGERLSAASHLPCSVENDGRCGLLGEYTAGALKGCRVGAAIVLGTSVGGGILINGSILTGAHDFAGKFAHILTTQNPSGARYSCFGEDNGNAFLCRLVAKHKQLSGIETLNGHIIFDLVEKNDREACAALREFCRTLAFQITNLQIILDPEIIVIAGGISSRAVLLDYISQQLELIYQSAPFPRPHSEIRLAALGNDANLVGACCTWNKLYF